MIEHQAQLFPDMRKGDDHGAVKAMINSFFGKKFKGLSDVLDNLSDTSGMSAVTCFPLGASMTWTTRAILGQEINLNRWHATASDAVILSGQACIAAFIQTGTKQSQALEKVLADQRLLQQEYDEMVAYRIFPRGNYYTVKVNTTFDMKRVLIPETLKPAINDFENSSLDGTQRKKYSYPHTSFETRPVYSENEYQQLIKAATHGVVGLGDFCVASTRDKQTP